MEAKSLLLYSLICSLYTVAAAFSVTFTESPAQCSPFTVTWKADSNGGRLGPPFSLLIIPVNGPQAASADATGLGSSALSRPIRMELSDSTFDASTKTGNFTIDQLALKAGEHFLVVMDDGFGFATGGVSSIHTVASTSGPSSCLGGLTSAPITLSTQTPAQCGNLNIITGPPSDIRGFVPGGPAFSLELGSGSSGDVTTAWTVNRPAGSNFVLMYRGKDGSMASSGLLGTAAGSSTSCLSGSDTLTRTASFSTSASMSTQTQSQPGGGSKVKVPAIVGGIIGGLAFIGLVALVTFYCIVRRTDVIGRPKSRSTLSPYVSGVSRDPTVTSGAGSNDYRGGGRTPNDNARSKHKSDLEAGFMGAIFGGGSVKKKGGYRNANERQMISSKKRREMYPGLSIASTQNRSIGLTTLDDDPPLPQRTSLDDMPPPNTITAYRDVKRSEARPAAAASRRVSGDSSSVMTSPMTAAPLPGQRMAGISEGSGYQSIPSSSGNRRRSLEDRAPIPPSATANTPTAWNPSTPNSKAKKSDRPSTAPTTQQYSPSGFHLPTRRPGEEEEEDGPDIRLHEYPPDRKDDDPRETSVTDDEIPRVRMDLLSLDVHDDNDGIGNGPNGSDERNARNEKHRLEEASLRRVLAQSAHPYALAQSPHPEDDENERRTPFTTPSSRRLQQQSQTQLTSPSSYTRSVDDHSYTSTSGLIGSNTAQTPSQSQGRSRGWSAVSHPYSNPSAVSHSEDGHPTRYGSNAGTQIIRHRDAGPMMGSEDGDEADESGRRRVLELPPSYGEITSSSRRRDR